MAKRRNRSSGGKDGESLKGEADKKEKLITNKVDATEEKRSIFPPKENPHQNSGSLRSDSPTSELCSILHGIELNLATPAKKTARRPVANRTSAPRKPKNRWKGVKKLFSGCEKAAETSPREEQHTPAPEVGKVENNDDEIVHDSQEMIDSNCTEVCYQFIHLALPVINTYEDDDDKLIMDAEKILLLYEHLSGEKCKLPEKSESPLRNEYRELYCIGTLCEKLSDIMSSKLASARQLRIQRMESLSQLKALSLRLEDLILANSAVEKYLSFDDTAQRDALEIMNIRYEELADDIFAADEEFLSMFDDDDVDEKNNEKVPTQPGYASDYNDSGGSYAGVCMQSKLTEVGLNYVDAVHGMIKRSTTEMAKCRALIAQQNRQIAATASEISSVREGLGDLAQIVDRVIGVTYLECSKSSMFKSRST
ncbi:hypothetical protein ANCCAN_20989 [Ancylostoma caninum]|uniref:Uncharacterized protein n=1 Tax=Ancylostoma caninum TaxID=29170 RepID=A0A368FQV2_ANCCA|nr:hypothetical protein ANCCAN_20989 [Ancylostoma caninum]